MLNSLSKSAVKPHPEGFDSGWQVLSSTSELQSRFEELLEKKKADILSPEEEAEYVGISELERIFTLINAQLAAKSKWCAKSVSD